MGEILGGGLNANLFVDGPNEWSQLANENSTSNQNPESLNDSPEEYERLKHEEFLLRNSCFETSDDCSKVLAGGVSDVYDLVEQKYGSNKELPDALANTSYASKNFNTHTTEALIDLIDVFYPSSFGNQVPSLSKNAAEEEYLITVNKNSSQLSAHIDDISESTSHFSEFDDAGVPFFVKQISNCVFEERNIAKRVIEYLENPDETVRRKLSYSLFNQNNEIAGQLKNLVAATIESNQDDFAESIHHTKNLYGEARDKNSAAILSYIDFKINHSSVQQSEASKEAELRRKKYEDLFI